ncbi:PAS-domain containing protein [Magnetospira sp. QH-2]|uniref:PAS-domain containing protein n=1 Tax=Magnetospira sp. (strain QH-2) TaxID=1288970 RepID=UPI0003E81151|nr:PAS-domain containing protein [Magnetospira sp. QH-2]CCQ74080.1 Putative histidine kinase with PAS 4 domain [Magnetospira sp. QH-2]
MQKRVAKYSEILSRGFNSLRTGLAIFDDDDRLVYCNEQFRFFFVSFEAIDDIIGFSYEQILRQILRNKDIQNQAALADPEQWIQQQLALHRESFNARTDRLGDGRWIDIKERRIPKGGAIVQWTDATDRMRYDIRLRSAAESIADGFAVWNADDRLELFNENYAKHHAPGLVLRPGIQYRDVLEVLAHSGDLVLKTRPDEWIAHRLAQRQLSVSEEVFQYVDDLYLDVKERRCEDGSVVVTMNDVSLLKLQEKELIFRGQTLEKTIYDLEMSKDTLERQGIELVNLSEALSQSRIELATVNEDLEDRIRERTADLAKSEARYRQMFEGNQAVALLVDPESNRIVDANQAAELFYGWTRDELLSLDMSMIDALSPAETNAEHLQSQAEGRDHNYLKHRLASGVERDVEVHSGPIELDGRTLLFWMIHDITERRAAEQELTEKNAELERSNAELEAFAYVASHDLREPLRNVTSFSTLLSRKLADRLDEDEQEYLRFIHDGAWRMDQLVRDLLELSRVGRVGEPIGEVPMKDVLEAVADHMRSRLEEFHAELEVLGDMPIVITSRDEIERVLLNLIGNALKYSFPDRSPRITVSAEFVDGVWRFCVADNGIGIQNGEGYEERIFRLFQRLHLRDEYGGGTGVGLAVCKKVIERHGGKIWVESEQGEGSRFYFTLRGHI